jgi:hypothetical protein
VAHRVDDSGLVDVELIHPPAIRVYVPVKMNARREPFEEPVKCRESLVARIVVVSDSQWRGMGQQDVEMACGP